MTEVGYHNMIRLHTISLEFMQTMIEIILCTNIFKYALNNALQALNFGVRQRWCTTGTHTL